MRKNILMVLSIAVLLSLTINLFAGNNNSQKDKLKVGLLEFSGETSGVNQNSIRAAMAEHLNSKGFAAVTDSSNGKFHYFVGVEIKKKGKSGITVIVTLYGSDKKVVATVTKSRGGQNDDSLRTVGGGSDDSIRPMILKGLDELASVIR